MDLMDSSLLGCLLLDVGTDGDSVPVTVLTDHHVVVSSVFPRPHVEHNTSSTLLFAFTYDNVHMCVDS